MIMPTDLRGPLAGRVDRFFCSRRVNTPEMQKKKKWTSTNYLLNHLNNNYLDLFRGVVRFQSNVDEHDPEVCHKNVTMWEQEGPCKALPHFVPFGMNVSLLAGYYRTVIGTKFYRNKHFRYTSVYALSILTDFKSENSKT